MTPYRKYQSAGSVPNSSFGSAYKYKGWQPPAFKPSSNPQFANSKRYLSDEPDEPKGGKVDWMGIGTAALNAGVGIANTVMTANKNIDLVGKEQRKKLNQEQALGLYRVNNQPYVGTNYAQTGGSIGNEYTGWQSPYGGIAEGYDPKLAAMSTQGILQKRNADIGLGVSDMVIEAASTAFPLIGALNAAQKSIRSGMGETAGQNREGKNVQTYDNLDAAAAGSTMKPLWEYASEHFAEGDIVRGLGSVFGGGLFQDINDNIRDTQDKLESQAVNQVSRSSGRTLGNASYASGSNVSARPMTSSTSSGGKMSLNRAQTGGQMGATKIEIENNEVIESPGGTYRTQDAPSHRYGGKTISVENGSRVFADNKGDKHMLVDGKTPSDRYQEIESSNMTSAQKAIAKASVFRDQEIAAGRSAPVINNDGIQIAQTGLDMNNYRLSSIIPPPQPPARASYAPYGVPQGLFVDPRLDPNFRMQGAVPQTQLYTTTSTQNSSSKPGKKKPQKASMTPMPQLMSSTATVPFSPGLMVPTAASLTPQAAMPTQGYPGVNSSGVKKTKGSDRTKAESLLSEYGIPVGMGLAGLTNLILQATGKFKSATPARAPKIKAEIAHAESVRNDASKKQVSEMLARSLDSASRAGMGTGSHGVKNIEFDRYRSATESLDEQRDNLNARIQTDMANQNAQRKLAADSENAKYQFESERERQYIEQAKNDYDLQKRGFIGNSLVGLAGNLANYKVDMDKEKETLGPETGMYRLRHDKRDYGKLMAETKASNPQLPNESSDAYRQRIDVLMLNKLG